jgi:hypothetical protein
MNTHETLAQLPLLKATPWFIWLACGAVSACTTGAGLIDEQAASDPTSGADSTSGAEGSTTLSGSDPDSGPSSSDGSSESPPPDLGPPSPTDPNEQIPPVDEEGCHGIFAQDLLPTFELTISESVWESLVWEWQNGQANEDLGVDTHPYHPLTEFRYGDIIITDAQIRLRGNPSNWEPENKMQFQIDFAEYHDSGHFLGLTKLLFDAAMYNRHMLRDRLALSIMRDMGVEAPCANNARLHVNGEYYGLFTSLEKLDEHFLTRVFDDPTGDLWDRHNWEIKTNVDTTNDGRLELLKDAETIEELETYLDLEQALAVFAAEAIIPNSDGPWAGGLNYYLYDDPLRGKFVLVPWDLDNVFERFNGPPDSDYPINPDPVVWEKTTTHGRPWYEMALEEPAWFAYYVQRIEQQLATGYAIEDLHTKIDTWTAQIQDSVFEDSNKPYSNDLYLNKVEELHEYVQGRHDFLVNWLVCWQNSGIPDQDGYCEPP